MTILLKILAILSFISAMVGYLYLLIGTLGAGVGAFYNNQETVNQHKKDIKIGVVILVLGLAAFVLITKYTA